MAARLRSGFAAGVAALPAAPLGRPRPGAAGFAGADVLLRLLGRAGGPERPESPVRPALLLRPAGFS